MDISYIMYWQDPEKNHDLFQRLKVFSPHQIVLNIVVSHEQFSIIFCIKKKG